ncbi:protein MGARP [Sceloporus undulatus]|uniref:protein MGARP n=1 Tax=Sceloporus undulatus TaxID=8520 RepID=UPI001C4B32F4|nr:protein MGARP [Sceloporus undulatus]
MHLCRVAWQALASSSRRRRLLLLLPRAPGPVLRGHAPFRQMSSGSVPGSSGENMIYYLIVVGAASAGGFYAYRTVTSDKARYNERVEDIQQRSTSEWKPKPWPPQSLENEEIDEKEVAETSEETKDAIQTGAEAETQEEAEAVTTDESQVENQTNTESTEVGRVESPIEEASSGVQEEQDATSTSETDKTQD